MKKYLFFFLIIMFLTGCETNQSIVTSIDEREANEIVVFLASKGIAAQKIAAAKAEGVGEATGITYDIFVDKDKAIQAMAILNRNGLPRIKGTNLLQLFSGKGLMTSDKEENIRLQAGKEEELKNTIRKIDGIIDADVRISFPTTEAGIAAETPKIKAAIYIKHQGILDDPNQHLESKIKKLVAGSIDNLSFDDVSIVSDRSRLTDIQLPAESLLIGPKALEKEYVKIWSIIMTKDSAKTFRFIFFSMILVIFIFLGTIGWLIYKFYPQLTQPKKTPK